MLITLPDASLVHLDEVTLRFTEVDGPDAVPAVEARGDSPGKSAFVVNCEKLAQGMTSPAWKFGDCFRRRVIRDPGSSPSIVPAWAPKGRVHDFDVTFLTRLYQFPGTYLGGTFCTSVKEWKFLDGGIVDVYGYGWASHSWTAVEGAEALRAICLFFGIEQPRKIKGEQARRPLARLLEEMTRVPLQRPERAPWGIPWPLEEDDARPGEVIP